MKEIYDWYMKHTTEAVLFTTAAQTILEGMADKGMPWWLYVALILIIEGGKMLKIKADNAAKVTAP